MRIPFDLQAFLKRAVNECPRCRGPRGDGLHCPACTVLVAHEEAARLQAERRQAEREREATAQRERDAREAFFRGICPLLYRDAKPDDLAPAVRSGIQRWGWRGPLYLWGPVGTGKTHCAWSIIRDWVLNERGGPPAFVRVADLLDAVARNRFADTDPVGCYASAGLLVLDDLAAGAATEFEKAALLRLVDGRVNSGLATVYTSNHAPSKLADVLDGRLCSRIFSGRVLVFDGPDRRTMQGRTP